MVVGYIAKQRIIQLYFQSKISLTHFEDSSTRRFQYSEADDLVNREKVPETRNAFKITRLR